VSYTELSDKHNPIDTFLFKGSTGVGKTELVIELAKSLDVNFIYL
jgi:ATP-dependent Clp protease ATP-binding subunit ClpA